MTPLPPDQVIRLGIVDDDPLVRNGLRLLLGGSPDIEIVAEAADGAEALTMAEAYRLDVILMDIRMPKVDGLIATQRIRCLPNPPQVIVLTTFCADDYVLDALRGGASGFLLKDTPPQDIIRAVRRVAAGAGTLSPAVIRGLIDFVADPASGSRRARARSRIDGLTDREREVALALGVGCTNAEICSRLRMSLPTVKGHVSRLIAKLEMNNRTQVAVLVNEAELI